MEGSPGLRLSGLLLGGAAMGVEVRYYLGGFLGSSSEATANPQNHTSGRAAPGAWVRPGRPQPVSLKVPGEEGEAATDTCHLCHQDPGTFCRRGSSTEACHGVDVLVGPLHLRSPTVGGPVPGSDKGWCGPSSQGPDGAPGPGGDCPLPQAGTWAKGGGPPRLPHRPAAGTLEPRGGPAATCAVVIWSPLPYADASPAPSQGSQSM